VPTSFKDLLDNNRVKEEKFVMMQTWVAPGVL